MASSKHLAALSCNAYRELSAEQRVPRESTANTPHAVTARPDYPSGQHGHQPQSCDGPGGGAQPNCRGGPLAHTREPRPPGVVAATPGRKQRQGQRQRRWPGQRLLAAAAAYNASHASRSRHGSEASPQKKTLKMSTTNNSGHPILSHLIYIRLHLGTPKKRLQDLDTDRASDRGPLTRPRGAHARTWVMTRAKSMAPTTHAKTALAAPQEGTIPHTNQVSPYLWPDSCSNK